MAIHRLAATALLAFAVLAATPKPHAVPSGDTTFALGNYTVHTNSLDYNYKTGDFSAPGKVLLTRKGGDITADRASGNGKTNIATLYGHVVVHDKNGNFAGLNGAKKASASGPATLTADRLQINGATKVYTATGNVHYTQNGTDVTANTGVLEDLKHTLLLNGNVHMSQAGRSMIADTVRYDTVTGLAHAKGNVTLQFPSSVHPHFATPKPIIIKNPKLGGKSSPSKSPPP